MQESGIITTHEAPAEFLAGLAEREDLRLYLLLDPLFHDEASAALYRLESSREHMPLFHGSTLKNMMRVSPWVSCLDFSTPMLGWLSGVNKPGWGMLLFSPAPLETILAHLRSLLLINAFGEKMIFRFWDGRIMERLAARCPEDMADLLGPAHYAFVRNDDLKWTSLRNPALDSGKAPELGYKARPCPWFVYEKRHSEAFQDKRLKVIGHNLSEDLYGRDDGLLYKVPADERPSLYVARQLDKAQSFGLNSVEALRRYAVCALLNGENFYANAPELFTETGGAPLEDESRVLEHLRRLTDGVQV